MPETHNEVFTAVRDLILAKNPRITPTEELRDTRSMAFAQEREERTESHPSEVPTFKR